jgi:hypothetical protein
MDFIKFALYGVDVGRTFGTHQNTSNSYSSACTQHHKTVRLLPSHFVYWIFLSNFRRLVERHNISSI